MEDQQVQLALPFPNHISCSNQVAWKSHQLELARAETLHGEKDQPRSISSIRRANTSDIKDDDITESEASELHPTSIGKLCASEFGSPEVHVVCSWTASDTFQGGVIEGEHHFRGLSVIPTRTCDECPLIATADFPKAISHDFRRGPAVRCC